MKAKEDAEEEYREDDNDLAASGDGGSGVIEVKKNGLCVKEKG